MACTDPTPRVKYVSVPGALSVGNQEGQDVRAEEAGLVTAVVAAAVPTPGDDRIPRVLTQLAVQGASAAQAMTGRKPYCPAAVWQERSAVPTISVPRPRIMLSLHGLRPQGLIPS
jgi:hypothetical protein